MHASDDEQESPTPHHKPTVSTASSFVNSFDDAFEETEDSNVSFDFSPAAIRAELAKNYSNGGADYGLPLDDDLGGLVAKIGFSEPDTSTHPFSVGRGNEHHSSNERLSPPLQPPSSSASRSPSLLSQAESFDDVNLTSDFSNVPLESPQTDDHGEVRPIHEQEEKTEVEEKTEQTHEAEDEDQHAEYPTVQIDVSQGVAVTTVLRADTPTAERPVSPPRASHEAQQRSISTTVLPLPPTPQSGNSISSTSSLPMPSSSSAPAGPSASTAPSETASHGASASHPSLFKHKSTRSAGPSMLDKVVSKTRPTYLPPKPRTEDKKHMHDWEAMMKRSRATEEKRRKALSERRMARERRIEESLTHWEKEIVPEWRLVYKDQRLRRLWWQGIPSKLRATMWQNAVGNELALSRDAYKMCITRARRALQSGSFPTTALAMLEDDIKGTLPSLHLFIPDRGPLYQDLKDMLCAWVVARSDEGLGYVPGIAKIAAMILLNMDPAPGFVLMRNLLERHCMRAFYGGMGSKDDVDAYYRIFDTLLADGMPKIYFNFKQHQISPASYLPDWLTSLFLDHLPFEACARLWDILLLEGDSFLFRASLGILAVLEPRLFFPDKTELLELLKGENKAALEIAKRDGCQLNGGKYEIYGVDEETLWERLNSMEDWWRESTWTRLIQRELPDL